MCVGWGGGGFRGGGVWEGELKDIGPRQKSGKTQLNLHISTGV